MPSSKRTPAAPNDAFDWVFLLIGVCFWLSIGLLALTGRWLPQLCPWAAQAFNNNPPLMLCVAVFTLTRVGWALACPTLYWRYFTSISALKQPQWRFIFWISFTTGLFWFTAGTPNAPTWLWMLTALSCYCLVAPYAQYRSDDPRTMNIADYSIHDPHQGWDSTISINTTPTHRYSSYPATNPTTGMPMVGSSGIDAGGNGFGCVSRHNF